MKTVKSLSAAASLAARYGGSLELDGQRINAGGAKATVTPLRPGGQAIEAVPTPAPAPGDSPSIGDVLTAQMHALQLQGQQLTSIVGAVLDRLAPPPAPPAAAPRRPASFSVVRNDKDEVTDLAVVYEDGPVSVPVELRGAKRSDGLLESITPVYAA